MEDCRNANAPLSEAYLEHWQTLRKRLMGRLGSRDLADEAMQETWIRLATLKAQPARVANPESYLLSIAGNIAIDLIRREKRHSSRAASDGVDIDKLLDDAPSVEDVVLARDELKQLVKALLKLSDKARRVLLMNRCLDMSHRDIAASLDISESMVAKYMAQALRHCRDHFRNTA